jgi:hypothetical protein
VHVDGRRLKAGKPRKAVRPKLGAGARRIKVVWTGLRRAKGKKLGGTVVVPVTISDSREKRTALRVRVRRG